MAGFIFDTDNSDITNDAGGTITIAGASVSAAGSANEIQFNDGASGFTASVELTWNDTTKTLSLGDGSTRLSIDVGAGSDSIIGSPNADLVLVGGSGGFQAARSTLQLNNSGPATLKASNQLALAAGNGFDAVIEGGEAFATAPTGDGGNVILSPGTPNGGAGVDGVVNIDNGDFQMGGTTILDQAGALTNVTASAAILTSGTLSDARLSNAAGNVGAFTNADITVDAKGRVTAAAVGASGVPTSRTLTAGAGLTGGGDLTANRTFAVGAGTGITVNANDVALNTGNSRNTDHAAVTLTAGSGLTGGGDISANRTFNVGAGTGITVGANDVAIANTAVTPAAYTNADITVDQQGRITAAANGSAGAGPTILVDSLTSSSAYTSNSLSTFGLTIGSLSASEDYLLEAFLIGIRFSGTGDLVWDFTYDGSGDVQASGFSIDAASSSPTHFAFSNINAGSTTNITETLTNSIYRFVHVTGWLNDTTSVSMRRASSVNGQSVTVSVGSWMRVTQMT